MAMQVTQAVKVLENRLPPHGGNNGSRTDCHAFHVPGVVQGMNNEKQNRLLELHSQI